MFSFQPSPPCSLIEHEQSISRISIWESLVTADALAGPNDVAINIIFLYFYDIVVLVMAK